MSQSDQIFQCDPRTRDPAARVVTRTTRVLILLPFPSHNLNVVHMLLLSLLLLLHDCAVVGVVGVVGAVDGLSFSDQSTRPAMKMFTRFEAMKVCELPLSLNSG